MNHVPSDDPVSAARRHYDAVTRNMDIGVLTRVENNQLTAEDLQSQKVQAAVDAWHAYLTLSNGAFFGRADGRLHHPV